MISKGNHVKFARFVLAVSEEGNIDFQVCFVDQARHRKIVEEKDSQNTKRSTKVAEKELFVDYVKEKKMRELFQSLS